MGDSHLKTFLGAAYSNNIDLGSGIIKEDWVKILFGKSSFRSLCGLNIPTNGDRKNYAFQGFSMRSSCGQDGQVVCVDFEIGGIIFYLFLDKPENLGIGSLHGSKLKDFVYHPPLLVLRNINNIHKIRFFINPFGLGKKIQYDRIGTYSGNSPLH